LTVTPAGMALLNRGRALVNEALNLRGAVIEASQGIKPILRVGLVDSFAATCGTSLVQQLVRDTDELSVRTGLTPNLGEALVRRELDLAISSRSLDVEGMVNHLLLSERFFLITPSSTGVICHTSSDVEALARVLPIVRFNQQSHLGEQAERALRRMGLNLPRRLEVDTADTLTSMVAGGIGWAITTPLCLLQASRSASSVRHHLVPELNAERRIYLHARKGEYELLAKKTFLSACEIVSTQISTELGSINPSLSGLIQTYPWSHNE
jgi:DNA-binding transcriptional LysR family regulator